MIDKCDRALEMVFTRLQVILTSEQRDTLVSALSEMKKDFQSLSSGKRPDCDEAHVDKVIAAVAEIQALVIYGPISKDAGEFITLFMNIVHNWNRLTCNSHVLEKILANTQGIIDGVMSLSQVVTLLSRLSAIVLSTIGSPEVYAVSKEYLDAIFSSQFDQELRLHGDRQDAQEDSSDEK